RGAYRFEALVRTAGITTDEGVGLRVLDAQSSHKLLIETERLRGTTDWKKLGGKLIVDSPVRLVEIQVFRRPSWRFDSSIAGTVWIDQVSLKREQPQPARRSTPPMTHSRQRRGCNPAGCG